MKQCSVCGVEKPKIDFYKDGSRPDGLDHRCKPCYNEVRKKRVMPTLEKHRSECVKCGESRLYLIDFHHINPQNKLFTIGDGKHSASSISKEISKCICLCKNCHFEFHYLYGKNPENPSLALSEYLEK